MPKRFIPFGSAAYASTIWSKQRIFRPGRVIPGRRRLLPEQESAGTLDYSEKRLSGYKNARRCVGGSEYKRACERLWEQIQSEMDFDRDKSYLVLGTEEFMYPALYVAGKAEERGCAVRCHATTRSPIAVSAESDYPVHCRYELTSLYEDERTTYLYDLDWVLILTDSREASERGVNSLIHALELANNKTIILYRWCEE